MYDLKMENEKDRAANIIGLSRRLTAVFSSIVVGLLLAFLIIFIGQGRQSTEPVFPDSPQQVIEERTPQFTRWVVANFKAWAGQESNPRNKSVDISLSPDGKYATITYALNTDDYTAITFNQEALTGHFNHAVYGNQFGYPFCDDYDGSLIVTLLQRYEFTGMPMPTEGIYIYLKKYSLETKTDKYGNSSSKRISEPNAQFGISISDFKKINWGGKGINLEALSTLIPFKNPDVSACNSDIVYGALLNVN